MAKKDKDYYGLLHLDPSADATMIQHAYWHLARALQAAAHTDPSACERLQELNEAYSVLATPALRAEYDQARRQPQEPAHPARTPPPKVHKERQPTPRQETQVSVRVVPVPAWQGALTAAVLLTLAVAALLAGANAFLVMGLVVAGLGFALLPLLRRLPRFPFLGWPALSRPRLRRRAVDIRIPRPSTAEVLALASKFPHLSQHREPEIDPGALRASTAATVARFREGVGSVPPLRVDEPTLEDDGQPAAHAPEETPPDR